MLALVTQATSTSVTVGLTAVTGTVTLVGRTGATLAVRTIDLASAGRRRGHVWGRRLVLLTEETLVTLRAARTVLLHVADALDDGLLETVTEGVAGIREAIELIDRVSGQIDQVMPVLDATGPTLGLMNGTLAQLNTTITQIDALPGVRMARRLVVRPVTPGRSSTPDA